MFGRWFVAAGLAAVAIGVWEGVHVVHDIVYQAQGKCDYLSCTRPWTLPTLAGELILVAAGTALVATWAYRLSRGPSTAGKVTKAKLRHHSRQARIRLSHETQSACERDGWRGLAVRSRRPQVVTASDAPSERQSRRQSRAERTLRLALSRQHCCAAASGCCSMRPSPRLQDLSATALERNHHSQKAIKECATGFGELDPWFMRVLRIRIADQELRNLKAMHVVRQGVGADAHGLREL